MALCKEYRIASYSLFILATLCQHQLGTQPRESRGWAQAVEDGHVEKKPHGHGDVHALHLGLLWFRCGLVREPLSDIELLTPEPVLSGVTCLC